jgi:hypothetical protein
MRDISDEALMKQAYISQLESPNKHDLTFLRSWFERPSMGGFPLRGLDRDAWHPADETDLVAIKPRRSLDRLSRWFFDKVMPLYHDTIGYRITVRKCLPLQGLTTHA